MNLSPFGQSTDDWLVYADYIDERDESQRAELIRQEVRGDTEIWNWEYRFGKIGVGVGIVGGVGVGIVGGVGVGIVGGVGGVGIVGVGGGGVGIVGVGGGGGGVGGVGGG